jgi:hypothetical protein
MLKRPLIKSNHRVLRINKVDTYGVPVLHLIKAPLFLTVNICTSPNELSVYIRFLLMLLSGSPSILGCLAMSVTFTLV